MNVRAMGRVLVGVAAAAGLLAVWGGQAALAQYPPPTGSATIVVSSTAPAPGSTVSLTITVRDAAGNPLAGKACTLSVTAQPGTGASVTPTSTTTNASGVVTATLNVGTTRGTVTVSAACEGAVLGATSVNVGGGAAPGVALPGTGTGDAGSGSAGFMSLLIALMAGGLVVLFAAGAKLRRSQRRS